MQNFTVYRSKSTVHQKTVVIRLEMMYNTDADISSEAENSLWSVSVPYGSMWETSGIVAKAAVFSSYHCKSILLLVWLQIRNSKRRIITGKIHHKYTILSGKMKDRVDHVYHGQPCISLFILIFIQCVLQERISVCDTRFFSDVLILFYKTAVTRLWSSCPNHLTGIVRNRILMRF